MIHNKEECGAVKRAMKFGIPHCYVDAKDEEKMVELFRVWRVDFIVLAGYMRIIKNPSAFHCPLINVHPSLLPKYKGLHAVEQALESGDKVTGCTVHYVNEELDGGEVILQSEVPILPEDDVKSLTKAIQRKEYAILPIVINEHLEKLQASIA
tara:strand:- start:211 stop:669 length:459 start_codon:yes stop_codon:yes gene_type:complete